jgi:death on curing protein
MKEPHWLQRETIDAIHAELLARFGGLAGIRDAGLLDSALHRPENLHAYGKPSLFDLAAEYTVGIVKNHPFLDGNKRTGFMAAYTFLGINGYQLTAPEEEAVYFTRSLAAGEMEAAAYALWLSRSCRLRQAP